MTSAISVIPEFFPFCFLFILNISIINYYINQVLYDKFSNYISIYTGFPINYSFLFLLICLEIYVCFKIKTL